MIVFITVCMGGGGCDRIFDGTNIQEGGHLHVGCYQTIVKKESEKWTKYLYNVYNTSA